MTPPPIYYENGVRKCHTQKNVIGAHLTPDGHGHTPMGCPGVRLEALQKFTICLRPSRPVFALMISCGFTGAGLLAKPALGFAKGR